MSHGSGDFFKHQASCFDAAASGLKGESPVAIRSALIKCGHWASAGRKARAKVVLPAPFGPARMRIFLRHDRFGEVKKRRLPGATG